jgi:subtilase family serine protease
MVVPMWSAFSRSLRTSTTMSVWSPLIHPTDGALSNAEPVTVTVFNYGQDPATGFNVSYQVDGGAVVTEPYVGTLASAVSAQFTFAATSDLSNVGQTYALQAYTGYAADEFNGNDTATTNVTHLYGIDLGVTAITSPSTGSGLSATANVVVAITNFGSVTQTSVPVFYTLNGGTPVQETYNGSIAAGASANFTFTASADLSALGTYALGRRNRGCKRRGSRATMTSRSP